MTSEVAAALPRDCRALAEAMDEAGKDLIRRGWGVEPLKGLMEAYRTSALCWTIRIDGEVAGMFGCAGETGGVGYPWLTTAPALSKARLRFVRQSGRYIDEMRRRHTSLISFAHQDNKALIGWLKWSGFEIEGRKGEFMICVYRRC